MVTIASAESNRATIKYLAETTWGTTPTTGTVRQMRYTSSSMVTDKQTAISDEIRADRMVANIIEVGGSNSGEINIEFSAGSLDDFFQAFLLGAWTKTMNHFFLKGSSISVTGVNTVTIAGGDYTDWLADGMWLKLEGFDNPENNAYLSINGAPVFSAGNTAITVDQTIVVETGSAFGKIMDAGDLIDTSTTIQLGTNSVTNLAASTTDTMEVGQIVYIEGLGKGTGTVTCTITDPTEGATITVSDGESTIIFEVRTDASLVAEGNVHVALSGTEATMATNIEAAIMDQFAQQKFKVSAIAAAAVVTITNNAGAGGSIATSDATAFTVVDFTGGDATKNGFFTVAGITSGTAFTTEETITADTNAGSDTVVVKGSHLRNPGTVADITKQSFTIETGFTDVAKYFVRKGMRVGTVALSVTAGELVSASVSFTGGSSSYSSTETLTGGSYLELASTNTEVMNATSNVGDIEKDGTALTTAIMSIEMNGESNLREQRAIGEKYPAGVGYGRFTLGGNLTAYFENFDLYDNFVNHDTTSLKFNFTDVDNLKYYFRIPALKITSDPVSPGGIDQDIMEEMEYQAQRDPSINSQFLIDRFSSVFPFAQV